MSCSARSSRSARRSVARRGSHHYTAMVPRAAASRDRAFWSEPRPTAERRSERCPLPSPCRTPRGVSPSAAAHPLTNFTGPSLRSSGALDLTPPFGNSASRARDAPASPSHGGRVAAESARPTHARRLGGATARSRRRRRARMGGWASLKKSAQLEASGGRFDGTVESRCAQRQGRNVCCLRRGLWRSVCRCFRGAGRFSDRSLRGQFSPLDGGCYVRDSQQRAQVAMGKRRLADL